MRELAIGNIAVLTGINRDKIKTFPVYLQDDITNLMQTFDNLSELEKAYFTYQNAFIIKEMFAQKTGNFARITNKNNVYGFSAL